VALRQLGNDDDLFRHFRCREIGPAVLEHGGLGQARAGARHHVAHHLLTLDRIGHAHGGGVGHAGVLEQHLVDLHRRDVHTATAADDEVLAPPTDADEAVLVHDREIARLDPRAAYPLDAAVLAQIADQAVRTADGHLALDIGRAWVSPPVHDLEILIERRDPDR